ncbi:hypothetical protein ACFSCX_13305 [Bacillus salitolerans]|uniref:Lipoprotein n=1 Tax=Bacillus salitolerans TaxID=1437434 RepID=A0ABW4LSS8_9BACI
MKLWQLAVIFILILSGCANNDLKREVLYVDKGTGVGYEFKSYHEITNQEIIEETTKILNDYEWIDIKISRISSPNYQISFKSKKDERFMIWVNEENHMVEIDNYNGQIKKLGTEDSKKMVEILSK